MYIHIYIYIYIYNYIHYIDKSLPSWASCVLPNPAARSPSQALRVPFSGNSLPAVAMKALEPWDGGKRRALIMMHSQKWWNRWDYVGI